MKKIMIVIFALGITMIYSCKKDREVTTTVIGQLRTNGTEDPIKMSNELTRPVVILYERIDQIGYTSSGYREFAKTTVDEQGRYKFKETLKKNELYFLGVENLDTSIYWQNDHSIWWGVALNRKITRVTPGEENLRNLYISSKAWVRPRFINTNPDPNNQDVFNLINDNIGPGQNTTYLDDPSNVLYVFLPLKGAQDTLAPWIYKTWSGKYSLGHEDDLIAYRHYVTGKLTRNGVTRDTNIFYFVPPFDTTIVEIRY